MSQFVVLVGPGINQRSIPEVLSGLDIRIESGWSALSHPVSHAAVLAVVVPHVTPAVMGTIRAVRRDHASLPIVLATAFSRRNVRRINRLPTLNDILPLEHLLKDLATTLKTAAARSALAEAAAWIESCDRLESDLRATLIRACRRRRPVRTVNSLANDVLGGSRSMLWRAWQNSDLVGTPHAFIDWLLAAHYFASGAGPLSGAATTLDVDRRTLLRALRVTLASTDPTTSPGSNQVLRSALEHLLGVPHETNMPDAD